MRRGRGELMMRKEQRGRERKKGETGSGE